MIEVELYREENKKSDQRTDRNGLRKLAFGCVETIENEKLKSLFT